MTVLIAAAILSLAAQVAQARPTTAGWISSAVPALAFLGLTKLALGRTTTPNGEPPCATATTPTAISAPTAENTTPTPTAAPAAATPTPETFRDLRPVPSGQLLISARMTAFSHQQATGQPITPGQLAERLAIPPPLAESLLEHIGGAPPPVTAVNGTPIHPEGRP